MVMQEPIVSNRSSLDRLLAPGRLQMFFKKKPSWDKIPSSEITPYDVYLNRRHRPSSSIEVAGIASASNRVTVPIASTRSG